jgi:hypothetical protein
MTRRATGIRKFNRCQHSHKIFYGAEVRLPPPDFVIAGAPKCGTSALYAGLKDDARIFLPVTKEPHYFSFDYPSQREVELLQDYDDLFRRAKPGQLRGEISVHYLSSTRAIPALLERRPDVKIIVFARNPVDLFVSWHNEAIRGLHDDVTSPEEAWRLQEVRARGECVPKSCKEPAFLQYGKFCSLGAQIQRLSQIVPAAQLLVLFHEDLVSAPRETLTRMGDHLGLAGGIQVTLAHENVFGHYTNAVVPKLLGTINGNPWLKSARLKVKPMLNQLGIRPLAWLVRRSFKSAPKPVLSEEFLGELRTAFSPDVALMEQLTGRRLSQWLDHRVKRTVPGG